MADVSSIKIGNTTYNIKDAVARAAIDAAKGVIRLSVPTFSSMSNKQVSDANITSDHVVIECVFSNPKAIASDVTWTTSNGKITLNGTMQGETTADIVLGKMTF